ncbi:MAG TPA: long-chain fatty acid--CoA ligase [Alphaproteobacteria bacterium]|nr:long-chain fatty acid--CoA ligase [Alphaproteobacteria bacterium]
MAVEPRHPADMPWAKSYPHDVTLEVSVPEEPFWRMAETAAAEFAALPALDFLGHRTSYRELGRLIDRAAAGFQALGVGRGVNVGLMLPNCPYYVICYFAVLKAGGTVVNYNPLYVVREIVHQIDDSETAIMVTLDLKLLYDKAALAMGQSGLKRLVVGRMAGLLPFPQNMLFTILKSQERARVPHDERHIVFDQLIANEGRVRTVPIDPRRDPAVLQYTGGTTGAPKGAELTHGNLWANLRQIEVWFPEVERGRERTLAVLPFFHVFAMTSVMNYTLYNGGLMILLPRFELKQVLETIDRKRPTLFPGVPTIYTAINNAPALARYNLSSIKMCISGAATLPLEIKRQFEAHTGCKLVEGYGLSEASPVVCCNPIGGLNKPGSIGLPVPGTDVRIMSLDAPPRPLPTGERGELWVHGPQVMAGYWHQPDETATTLTDGWLHTGDVGYMDEDGYFFIVDRLKEVIIAGGYKIYPRLVEEAIYQHPAVAEAAVVGVPDPYRGHTVKAFVVRHDGAELDAAGLLAFLADKLSPIEMPKLVEFRHELPKSAVGKILKLALLKGEETQPAGSKGG